MHNLSHMKTWEAAQFLGITRQAIDSRIKRGTCHIDKFIYKGLSGEIITIKAIPFNEVMRMYDEKVEAMR